MAGEPFEGEETKKEATSAGPAPIAVTPETTLTETTSEAATLQEHAGSDKSWVWHASDYSDGELKEELFCLRLGSVKSARKFKSAFEEAQEKAGKIDKKPDAKVDEAAHALGSLKVADKTEESPAEGGSRAALAKVTSSKAGTSGGMELPTEDFEVVYVKENVSIHPTQHVNGRIHGRLGLVK